MPGMAGWSHSVDGVELNAGPTLSVCTVPEIDNLQEQDLILAPIDGDYPVVIRMQPREGQYTFLVDMGGCLPTVYQSRFATIKAALSQGPHSYSFQVRGMTSPKTLLIVVRSLQADYTRRAITANATAAKPVPV